MLSWYAGYCLGNIQVGLDPEVAIQVPRPALAGDANQI